MKATFIGVTRLINIVQYICRSYWPQMTIHSFSEIYMEYIYISMFSEIYYTIYNVHLEYICSILHVHIVVVSSSHNIVLFNL